MAAAMMVAPRINSKRSKLFSDNTAWFTWRANLELKKSLPSLRPMEECAATFTT